VEIDRVFAYRSGAGETMRICIILFTALIVSGCASDERVARLEKQTEELKGEIKKSQEAADFDLQAKCGKDARTWFQDNWSRDKDTVLLTFTDHYNKAQNKCFIFVEYHYRQDQKSGSWTNDITLTDVYENVKYAEFGESHLLFYKPTVHSTDEVFDCEAYGKKCSTIDEFNNLIRPYMNN
jgi:hypothetical protein